MLVKPQIQNQYQAFYRWNGLIKWLRPISYDWKGDGRRDVGLGAEDVEAVSRDFATIDMEGNTAGVKYERLSILFINALKEQQKIIERQQRQLNQLKRIVCSGRKQSSFCKGK